MIHNEGQIIGDYLRQQNDIFTSDSFYRYLKSEGVKITKNQVLDILYSSDFVFPLINNEFITRSGVFSGRWFSFKPSKEEVKKGYFILGHRCMPFTNPEISPDNIVLIHKGQLIETEAVKFSMNLALDTYAFYGEGYSIPFIINDKSNDTVSLASIQYGLPQDIKLTAWPLNQIAKNGKFNYGDRILCKVINWEECVVQIEVLKNSIEGLSVSQEHLIREEWYSQFEQDLLQSFNKNGPTGSIEEQLSLLFLEHQAELCIRECGSIEEFIAHTKKINFAPFGVENRLWKTGSEVPFTGSWTNNAGTEALIAEVSMTLSPQIIDAYIENYIHEVKEKKSKETLEELIFKILPQEMNIPNSERNLLLLNIEKRHAILLKEYNQFLDYSIINIRKRVIELFSQCCTLLSSIGNSGIGIELFPQQELIILSQLFSHLARLLDEMENKFLRDQFPVSDVEVSLNGMEETFYDIEGTLKTALKNNKYKCFKLNN